MSEKYPNFCIPFKQLTLQTPAQLGLDLHCLRMCAGESIYECAQKLDVSPEEIDTLERCCGEKLNLSLALRMADLYDDKIFIAVGSEYE